MRARRATLGTRWHRITPVPWMRVEVHDTFWSPRMETNRKVTLPLEYERDKKIGAVESYQWEWNPNKPPPPWRIWVGDMGKWIEAVAYTLATHPDEELKGKVEYAIESVIRGQKDDGYLYSNPVAPDKRWTNLRDRHELYDVGHMIEAAVAYYEATGRRELLDAMRRCADLLDANFGPEPEKRHAYDGHPEIELALVRLYRATGEKRYLRLAKFFIDERGQRPCYFDLEAKARGEDPKESGPYKWSPDSPYMILQAHLPVREQREAVGHAVRAMYLYSGIADVAAETCDEELLETCRRLWRSATHRRMYVIGAIGSTANGEAFTRDFDLPNETAYAETCANIALVFFAHRMLQIEPDSEYADVMEKSLYNGVLSGISLDGRRFFYANHLEAFPQPLEEIEGHVANGRQDWFSCACCPPNLSRIIAGIGGYIYSTKQDKLYVHLYIGSRLEFQIDGHKVVLTQRTDYPWREQVAMTVRTEAPTKFTVALRMPGWCGRPKLSVNGKRINIRPILKSGYAAITREWWKGDRIKLVLPMPVERVEAHPSVRMDCAKVAIQRGPMVYCIEEADNGPYLSDVVLCRIPRLTARYVPDKLGGIVVVRGKARRRDANRWGDQLYRSERSKTRPMDLVAIPYFLWANRGPGEMLVWMHGVS